MWPARSQCEVFPVCRISLVWLQAAGFQLVKYPFCSERSGRLLQGVKIYTLLFWKEWATPLRRKTYIYFVLKGVSDSFKNEKLGVFHYFSFWKEWHLFYIFRIIFVSYFYKSLSFLSREKLFHFIILLTIYYITHIVSPTRVYKWILYLSPPEEVILSESTVN